MQSKICVFCVGLIALFGWAAPAASPDGAGTNDVYVIPFSHLDLFWAGTREECLSRGGRIISKAMQIAERQPEFRFLIEDEVFTANYVEAHRGTPELETFKRLVKEGRFELSPKWAGIYQNLPRGEAHVRNHLYGKLYAREVFQVNPQVSHLGDLPGYTEQYPQICAKSDTPYMAMTRMGPPEHPLFRWRSPDGSTALVWYAVNGYGWGVGIRVPPDQPGRNRPQENRAKRRVGSGQNQWPDLRWLGHGFVCAERPDCPEHSDGERTAGADAFQRRDAGGFLPGRVESQRTSRA